MEIKNRIQALWQHGSLAEQQLWRALSNLPDYPHFDTAVQAFTFVRHVPIGDFIVDFVCPGLSLAIVLDNGCYQAVERIAGHRTTVLQYKGYVVIQLRQQDVVEHWHNVLKHLNLVCCQRLAAQCKAKRDAVGLQGELSWI